MYDETTVLQLVKARLNRREGDMSLDTYLKARIKAADEELGRNGIKLKTESTADALLLADMTVWQYQNRDSPVAFPDGLRLRRRERWLVEKQVIE